MVPRAQASADRINEVLNTDSEIKDVPNPELLSLKGDKATLAFEHVNYRYQHAEKLSTGRYRFFSKIWGDGCNYWWDRFWEKQRWLIFYHVFL